MYMSPLVDKLAILWNIPETFKACLLCVACDIPASRKVCGFTGHNSVHGCNKCTKTFLTGSVGDKTGFLGFEPCP